VIAQNGVIFQFHQETKSSVLSLWCLTPTPTPTQKKYFPMGASHPHPQKRMKKQSLSAKMSDRSDSSEVRSSRAPQNNNLVEMIISG